MRDNVKTFETAKPLSEAELALLLDIAERLKDSVPCTACRYCCEGCPKGLDIPSLLSIYNELRVQMSPNASRTVEFLPEDKKPSACIGCGKCTRICPQNIDIPGALKDLTEKVARIPSWAETCRQREEAAKRNKMK